MTPRPDEPTRVQVPRRRTSSERAQGVAGRIRRAWRALTADQRLAAVAALALLLSMLLPWYQESDTLVVNGRAEKVSNTLNAFEVYSFIEAAIFVVALGVLVLLFARGERRTFHLPGGDGTVIMAAGAWTMLLIFYRQFDRPDRHGPTGASVDVSVSWGIFIAFILGGVLAYAGYRTRAAHVPEPVVDGTAPSPSPASPAPFSRPDAPTPVPADAEPTAVARRRPERPSGDDDDRYEGQLSFDEPAEYRPPPRS